MSTLAPTRRITADEFSRGDRLAFAPDERSAPDLAVKQSIERLLALIGLIALSPVLLAVAVAVAATSRGPVLHRRRVLGHRGRTFDALKFRTMVADADARLEADPALRHRFEQQFKLTDDPRITTIGRFLRKSSLDELPQLWNVLRGDMALVGPRIISPPELARYGDQGQRLLSVRPGLTGLWQVSGRQKTTYEERVLLDMQYIDRWSLWLDLRILARTIPVVLGTDGAH